MCIRDRYQRRVHGQIIAKANGAATINFSYQDLLGNIQSGQFQVNVQTFPLTSELFNSSICGTGLFDEANKTLTTAQYGFGGWKYANGLNLSNYKYLVVELAEKQTCGASFRLFDTSNYWTDCYMYEIGDKLKVAIDLSNLSKSKTPALKCDPSHLYIIGIWSYGSSPIKIKDIYLSNDGEPSVGIPVIDNDNSNELVDVYSMVGVKLRSQVQRKNALDGLNRGVYVVGHKCVMVKQHNQIQNQINLTYFVCY
eukprot:TRINITY_DN13417_c0_g1_i1.p1 TRINITY_DN13417_c0_g1~~TRINITY_DN13417_c0_g1_i1.p1  ORF type:complete len:253 (-),score=26.25 TRINITY_DN13417_c0_g1_i1:571-1329(-)